MIVNFSITNVFSFKDKQTLSFQPEGLKELRNHVHEPLMFSPPEELLKSIALYGHNSYGKSNFIKALLFFRDFVETSFTQPGFLRVEPFLLNTSTQNAASSFEIIFYIADIKYRYGFQVKSNRIISEGLYYSSVGVRENHLFQRVEQDVFINKTWNKENGNKLEIQCIPFASDNILLLSVMKAQSISHIKEIAKKISEMIIITEVDKETLAKAVLIFSDNIYQERILSFIKNADLGFISIFDKIETKIKSSKLEKDLLNIWYRDQIKRFDLFTWHELYNENLDQVGNIEFDFLKKESEGSVKFFILTSFFIYAIVNNIFICIDELDSKLHVDLLKFIIKEYHDPNVNLSTAQLIFTSHNTVILDRQLRRDQFVVVEKTIRGESKLKKLHTKETPIRIDTSMEKEYRKGYLGGVSKKVIAKNNNQGSLFDDL